MDGQTDRQPLHFTQGSLYTEQLLHKAPFTHRSFYTEKPLHRAAFTNKTICTEKPLHTEAFTQRSLYTEQLLRTKPFAQRSLCTQKLLHRAVFTQKPFTHALLHREARRQSRQPASYRGPKCRAKLIQRSGYRQVDRDKLIETS